MVKCNKCGHKYSGESKYGTCNPKRHLEKCLKSTTRDIGQYLPSSDHSSMVITRNAKFNQKKNLETCCCMQSLDMICHFHLWSMRELEIY